MVKNLTISVKLFLTHSVIGLVVTIVMSYAFYALMRDALIERTVDQLSSINILKKGFIEDHFRKSEQILQSAEVQRNFIRLYKLAAAAKSNGVVTTSDEGKEIEQFLSFYHFKNLYLFNKGDDELMRTSAYVDEKLISKMNGVVQASPEKLHLIDASVLSPDKKALLFYYVPIITDTTVLGGVLIEEDFQKIQHILLENTGMGNTGESYVVGNDYLLRSQSRFLPDAPPLRVKVKPFATIPVSQKNSLNHIIYDYRNEKVISVHRGIGIEDLEWTLISEMDFKEAMYPIISLRNYLIVITLIIIGMIIVITFFLSNIIAKPILQLKDKIVSLSMGVIPKNRLPSTSTHEIIEITKSLDQLINGLKRTTEFAQQIGSGNFKSSFKTLSEEDSLGLALLQMRKELQSIKEKESALERERAIALLEGQENERKRIILELHDGVGQMLTAIRMRVDLLEADAVSKQEIKDGIKETIAEVKRISYNVMPHSIIDYGLEAALKDLCNNLKKYASLTIDFRYVKDSGRRISFDKSIAIFRIVQEGLNNIVKHAKAMDVTLHLLEKEEELYLILEDNGKGFDENELAFTGGLGLKNIRERVKLLNGQVSIHSSPNKGTSIEIHIPIDN